MRLCKIKVLSCAFAIANLAVLFIFDYVILRILTVNQSVKFMDATKLSPVLWFLVFIPAFLIVLPFIKDIFGKYYAIVSITLPIIGALLHVMLYFIFKGRYFSEVLKIVDSFGLGSSLSVVTQLNAGLGFYLVLVTYLSLFVVHVMASKDVDLGSERLNTVVNKMTDIASNIGHRDAKQEDSTKNTG